MRVDGRAVGAFITIKITYWGKQTHEMTCCHQQPQTTTVERRGQRSPRSCLRFSAGSLRGCGPSSPLNQSLMTLLWLRSSAAVRLQNPSRCHRKWPLTHLNQTRRGDSSKSASAQNNRSASSRAGRGGVCIRVKTERVTDTKSSKAGKQNPKKASR